MKHIALITLVVIVGIQEVHAQVTIQSKPISLMTVCMNEAIQRGYITKDKTFIMFTCQGNGAMRFFQYLGRNRETFVSNTSTGRYRVRLLNENDVNKCWQQVENPDGSPTVQYGCNLYFSAGEFINE